MSNEYYQSGEERAAKVNQLFDHIADRYDLINDVQSLGMHRVWKKWLWLLTRPAHGAKVLDLCCGTGDIAGLFANKGCQVTGLDFSEKMLEVARKHDHAKGVKFQQGDAMQTGFADNTFDAITIGYGLRNLSDCGAGLLEIKRILKPGGHVAILDFGKPDNLLLRVAYYAYLYTAVPIFGRVFAGDSAAYAYILESLKHYPAQRGVNDLLEVIGFEETRIINFFGGTMSINHAVKPTLSSA